MFDSCFVADILHQIEWSLVQIAKRFSVMHAPEDFVADDAEREKLDSICRQLIAVGEALKQVDKLAGTEFLSKYASIDWKKAKGLRDIITHHYFDIYTETVLAVCSLQRPKMQNMIRQILLGLYQ